MLIETLHRLSRLQSQYLCSTIAWLLVGNDSVCVAGKGFASLLGLKDPLSPSSSELRQDPALVLSQLDLTQRL